MLKTVVDRVDSIAREQTLEAGRKEGRATTEALIAKNGETRSAWARALVPVVIALGPYVLAQFVIDVVAARGGSEAAMAASE